MNSNTQNIDAFPESGLIHFSHEQPSQDVTGPYIAYDKQWPDVVDLVFNKPDADVVAKLFCKRGEAILCQDFTLSRLARASEVIIWCDHSIAGRQQALSTAKQIINYPDCRAVVEIRDPIETGNLARYEGLSLADINNAEEIFNPYEDSRLIWHSSWLPAVTGKSAATENNEEVFVLDALSPQPPARESEWILGGILEVGTINLCCGMAGYSGKTTTALGLVARIDQGQKFCGRPTISGPSVYVSFEGDDSRMRRQLDAMGGHHVRIIHQPGPRTANDGILALFELAVTSGAVLIVVDTLQSLLPDVELIDGRKYGESYEAGKRLAWIARYTGVTFLFLHHTTGKDELMGNQGIYAAADSILHLSKAHELVSMFQRSGVPLQKTKIRFDAERYLILNDIDEVEEVSLDDRILAALASAPLTTEQVKAAVHEKTRHTVADHLAGLVSSGKLTVSKGKKKGRGPKPNVYHLA